MFMIQLKKEHFFFAVWTLQRVIAHSKQEPLTPGIELKDDPVFGLMDSFMQLFVDSAVSGIKTIVSCHLEIFFRDVLDEQFNKINRRKSSSDEGIVFVFVVMEGYIIPIIGINPGKGDNWAAKVSADIPDNGVWVAEVGLCVNIKTIFVFAV